MYFSKKIFVSTKAYQYRWMMEFKSCPCFKKNQISLFKPNNNLFWDMWNYIRWNNTHTNVRQSFIIFIPLLAYNCVIFVCFFQRIKIEKFFKKKIKKIGSNLQIVQRVECVRTKCWRAMGIELFIRTFNRQLASHELHISTLLLFFNIFDLTSHKFVTLKYSKIKIYISDCESWNNIKLF